VEFLGIGYQEVLLVFVLMLVVVGPQRMPQVAYQIGRAVREMQKYARAVRDEFSEEWEYLDSQAKELRGEVDSASKDLAEVRRSLRAETDKMDAELKAASAEAEAAIPTGKTATPARTPSPLPGKTSGSPTRTPATISTNGAALKPLALKPKDAAATKQAKADEPGGTEREKETAAAPAKKPPLVF
jgi:sec-independent protein translocase protein TatB